MKKITIVILIALMLVSCSSTKSNKKAADDAVVLDQGEHQEESLEVAEEYTPDAEEEVSEELPLVINEVKESAFFVPTEEPMYSVILLGGEEETVPIQDVVEKEEPEAEPPVPAPIVVEQKKTVLQNMEDTLKGEGEPKEALINGNVIPMWFTYTCAFIVLAILFTLCYIAKQRKEAVRWSGRN